MSNIDTGDSRLIKPDDAEHERILKIATPVVHGLMALPSGFAINVLIAIVANLVINVRYKNGITPVSMWDKRIAPAIRATLAENLYQYHNMCQIEALMDNLKACTADHPKTFKGAINDWYREPTGGGGYVIRGSLDVRYDFSGEMSATSRVVGEYMPRQIGDGISKIVVTEIETLNSRYMLVGDQVRDLGVKPVMMDAVRQG